MKGEFMEQSFGRFRAVTRALDDGTWESVIYHQETGNEVWRDTFKDEVEALGGHQQACGMARQWSLVN